MQNNQISHASKFAYIATSEVGTKFLTCKSDFATLYPWKTSEDLAKLLSTIDNDADWYITPASFVNMVGGFQAPGDPTRASRNALQANSFWLDLDVGDAKDKYPTQVAALKGLRDWCETAAIPSPTIEISSGVGIQVYWALYEPVSAELWTETAFKLKALTKHYGLKADPSRTADIASLMRLPGTFNTKATEETCASDGRIASHGYCAMIGEPSEACRLATLVTSIDVAYSKIASEVPVTVTEATFQADPSFTLADLEHALNESEEGLAAADEDYIGRLKTIAAVYRQFDGDERALEILTRWIKRGVRNVEEHGEEHMVQQVFGRWNSLHQQGFHGAVSTLARFQTVVKKQQREERVRGGKIGLAPTQDSEFASLPMVSPSLPSQTHIATNAAVATNNISLLPTVASEKLTKAQKDSIQQSRMEEEAAKGLPNVPDWLKDVAYIARENRFYIGGTGIDIGVDAFNMVYTPYFRRHETACKKPSEFAVQVAKVPLVIGGKYRPNLGSLLPAPPTALGDPQCYINTFDRASAVRPATEPTEEGKKLWELLNIHLLEGICNRDEGAKAALLDVLMWNLKYPGVRLGQAVVISGVNGIGKSILTQLVSACFGAAATPSLRSDYLLQKNNFNSLMNQGVLGYTDELPDSEKVTEIFDIMKEYVSNATVGVTFKGKNTVIEENHQNWIAFTNYGSRVRLDANERRIMYIHSEWPDQHAYAKHLYETYGIENWGKMLHTLITANPDQLLYFAGQHKFRDGFGQDTLPYNTAARIEVIERPSSGWLDTATGIIEGSDEVYASEHDAEYRLITKEMFSINALVKLILHQEGLHASKARAVDSFVREVLLPQIGYKHLVFHSDNKKDTNKHRIKLALAGNAQQKMAVPKNSPIKTREDVHVWAKARREVQFTPQSKAYK